MSWAYRWGLWWIKRVFSGVKAGYSGNALFLFFITREGGGYKMVAHWLKLPFGWCVWSAAEHTALKEAFLQPQRKSSTNSDPRKKTPLHPPLLQTPSSFLPTSLWLDSRCFMWHDWGRLEVGPHPCPQKTLVFQWHEGSVGVGRVEQWGGGAQRMKGGSLPPGRGGNKRRGALSHALFVQTSKHLWRGRWYLFGYFHSPDPIPKNPRST